MGRTGAVVRRAALAVSLSGVAACTLLSGVDELAGGERGGLDGSDTDSSGTSGGSSGTSGTSSGGIDGAPMPDTGTPPPDGSGADVPPGPASWCSSRSPKPRTCLDFDAIDIDTLERKTELGTLSFDNAGASPPNALFAGIDDGKEGRAYVRVPLGASPPSRVAWSFDVRLDQGGSLVEFGELRLLYGAGGICAIQPSLENGKIEVNEYCDGAAGPLQLNHLATNAGGGSGYYHFDIAVDFGPRTLTALVRRPDGTTGAVDVALDAKVVAAPAELRAGVSWAPARPTGARVRLDNVTLDWQ